MNEPQKTPTLEDIKANLLEVRDNVNFNIGSPAAIDHLLISLVMVIDALSLDKNDNEDHIQRSVSQAESEGY